MYLLRFIYRILARVRYVLSTCKKEEKRATICLHALEQQFGGVLDEETFKKIVHSYAIYVPMMCDAFTSLQGRKTNSAERDRMLHYFICSSLFDNFCDRKELPADALRRIMFSPENYPAQRMEERLFLHSYLLLRSTVPEKDAYREALERLTEAQIASDKQFDKSTSDVEIERITFEKGGYSVLLCRFCLDGPSSATEKRCWYQAGRIIQLTNDLYDIHKDLQEHSETLPNRMRDAYAFDRFFSALVRDLQDEIVQLPFPAEQKQDLVISLAGICSFGKLALHRLKKIQGSKPQLPDLGSLPRKSLIVDMEKPASMWYCVKYVYRQAKRHREMINQSR